MTTFITEQVKTDSITSTSRAYGILHAGFILLPQLNGGLEAE